MSLYAFNIWENICYFISINKLNLWKTPVHYSVAIVYRLKKTEESKPSQVWNVTDATTQNYKLGLQVYNSFLVVTQGTAVKNALKSI